MEFLEMQLGSVTLMLAETIVRKTRAKFPHQCVARHLCDHARRRNAQAQAIAIDDRCLWQRERENRQAIDQRMLGRNRKAGDRDPHRLMRGAQDIDPIDLDRIDNPDCPDDVGTIRQVSGRSPRAAPAKAALNRSISGAGNAPAKSPRRPRPVRRARPGRLHRSRRCARRLTSAVFFRAGIRSACCGSLSTDFTD